MKFSIWWACAIGTEWLLIPLKYFLWFLMISAMYNSIHKSCLKVSGFFLNYWHLSCVGQWSATVNLVLAYLQSDDALCSAMLIFFFLDSFIHSLYRNIAPGEGCFISTENCSKLQLSSDITLPKQNIQCNFWLLHTHFLSPDFHFYFIP